MLGSARWRWLVIAVVILPLVGIACWLVGWVIWSQRLEGELGKLLIPPARPSAAERVAEAPAARPPSVPAPPVTRAAAAPAGAPGSTPGPAPGPATAPATAPAPLAPETAEAPDAPDEQRVARLIRQMGADDFATREHASEEMTKLGPEVVPALAIYRQHADPEIALRVRQVIASFAWMTHGALVIEVRPGTRAAQGGVRVGDVLVKVDDQPITGYGDAGQGDARQPHTYYFWRNGKVEVIKLAPGNVGVQLVNWELDKGGSDQARGLAAFAAAAERNPDFAEAYRRLKAAGQSGMDDRWSLLLAAELGEDQRDHAGAFPLYERSRAETPSEACVESHAYANVQPPHPRLEQQALTAARLLARLRAEPFSPELYHQVEGFALAKSHNLALARQAAAGPWGDAAELSNHYRAVHGRTAALLALFDHRWPDLLAAYRAFGQYACVEELAMVAAVRLGRGSELSGMAARCLSGEVHDFYFGEEGVALECLTLACLQGDLDTARQIAAQIQQVPDNRRNRVFDRHVRALLHRQTIPVALPLLAPVVTARTVEARDVYLRLLLADPATTSARWREEWGRLSAPGRALADLDTAAALRFGEFDRITSPAATLPVKATIAFLKASSAKLAGEWAPLQGAVRVFPDTGPVRWVLRYDGRLFRLDDQGRVTQPPGLSGQPLQAPVLTQQIDGRDRAAQWSGATGLEAWCYDEAAGRWVDPRQSDLPVRAYGQSHQHVQLLAERYVAKTYPRPEGLRAVDQYPRAVTSQPQPGAVRMMGPTVGTWTAVWFEGDLTILVSRGGEVLDVNRAIARALGRNTPVAVYREVGLRFPTSVGLWEFDERAGKFTQVPLGLPDNCVPVVLPRDAERARQYVGLPPERGGQIIELFADGRPPRVTGGFNGWGVDTWASEERAYHFAGHEVAALVQELADAAERKESGPATRPAAGP